MANNARRPLSTLMFLSVLLFGCNSNADALTELPTTEPLGGNADTETPVPIVMKTPQMAITELVVTQGPPIEISETLVPTPFPTSEYSTYIDYLSYLNSLQCVAPCFWGIIPKSTSREEVNELAMRFEQIDATNVEWARSQNHTSIQIRVEDWDTIFALEFTFDGHFVDIIRIDVSTFEGMHPRPGVETELNPGYLSVVEEFQPPTLLIEHNLPAEVLIRTFYPGPNEWPTQTFVNYWFEGLLILYLNPSYNVPSEEKVYFCIYDNPRLTIWLFDSNKFKNADDVWTSLELLEDFALSVDKLLAMKQDEFFEWQANDSTCEQKYVGLSYSTFEWSSFYINP